MVFTTVFHLLISGGTGRFKGLTGTIDQDGAAVPNLSPTGSISSAARVNGNFGIVFGSA